jgi:cobalt-zinc-cadmium efflux system outer membrane protein
MKGTAILCVLASAIAASGAAAQEAEALSLTELIEMVREQSPASRAVRARVAVADAEVGLAGVYPNPVLGYVVMGRVDGTNQAINGTQHQAWLDFPLLLAAQHEARRAAAQGTARATRAEVELELLALEIEARRVFVTLLAAQERAGRLSAAREELDGLLQIVRQRARAGAQSPYDDARIGLEISRVDAELATARAEEAAAQAGLAALAGRRGWQPRAAGTLESLQVELRRAEQIPAVLAMERRVEAAALDVERAERERVPEIRLGVGSYLTTDPDSASIYAGVTVPLPVFDTGDAAVSRARAARSAAEEARDAIEAQTHARLEGLLATLRARREALARFDAETLSRLPAIQEMAEASYRLGASGVFELLDTFRARFELELQRVELLVQMVEAQTDVIAIAGR